MSSKSINRNSWVKKPLIDVIHFIPPFNILWSAVIASSGLFFSGNYSAYQKQLIDIDFYVIGTSDY